MAESGRVVLVTGGTRGIETNIVLEGGGDWPDFPRPHGALNEPS